MGVLPNTSLTCGVVHGQFNTLLETNIQQRNRASGGSIHCRRWIDHGAPHRRGSLCPHRKLFLCPCSLSFFCLEACPSSLEENWTRHIKLAMFSCERVTSDVRAQQPLAIVQVYPVLCPSFVPYARNDRKRYTIQTVVSSAYYFTFSDTLRAYGR